MPDSLSILPATPDLGGGEAPGTAGRRARWSATRDLVVVVFVVLAALASAAVFDFTEHYTRWVGALSASLGRDLELDELPAMLSFAALGFAWYAFRRWQQLREEIGGHALTTARLEDALARARSAEERAARSERRLVDAIELIPEGFVLFDTDDRFVLWNSKYAEFYSGSSDLIAVGARYEDALRASIERGHVPEAIGREEEWIAARLMAHKSALGAQEERLSDGRWLRVAERRLSDGGVIGIRIDITELKRREAQTRVLFEANPVPMYVFERGSRCFIDVNAAALAQYGYTREEFLSLTADDIRPASEHVRFHTSLALQMGDFERLGCWRHKRSDGSELDVEVFAHSFLQDGRDARLNAAVDISEQRRAEQSLLESEARLRRSEKHLAHAQRLAEIGSFERDQRTGEVYWSDQLYTIFGVDKGTFQVTSESILAMIHPEDREFYVAWRQQSPDDAPHIDQYRIVRPTGEVRVLTCERGSVRDEGGAVVRAVGTVRDITDALAAERRQRELEAQLRHSQRLEALGTLAGGIAHDLNNTLVPVVALSAVIEKRYPQASELVALIRQAGTRARDLVRQIVAFSRKEEPTRQLMDLSAFVREALPMIRATVPTTIAIDLLTPEELPKIFADPSQIHQVLLNLVTNAVQAIDGSIGRIGIAVAVSQLAELPALCLSVEDDGCGMAPATVDRIFDPFFTTKPVGQGTGLGMSVVHGIVTQHGGRIEVTSALGQGSRFDITIPAAEPVG